MIKLNNFHIVFFCYLKLYVYMYLCINFTLIMLKKKNRNDFEICKRKTQKRLLTCYYYVTVLSIE